MQSSTDAPLARLEIGAPVYCPIGSKIGHVARLEAEACAVYALGQGGLARSRSRVVVVFDDLEMSTVADTIAQDWAHWAAQRELSPISPAEAAARLAQAEAKRAARQAQIKAEAEAVHAALERHRAEVADKIPSWAQSVIVAELERDDSDAMTDYFSTRTVRTVILGFSRHTRDLFPELRKMARHFDETAHLADAPASAEHREKYSMGAGYYLKAGGRYSSGWRVRKLRLYNDPASVIPIGAEWCLAPSPAVAEPAPSAATDGIRIEEHLHTKMGVTIYICVLPGRVDRAEFERLLEVARALGGWYSRPWGATPGGFAFRDRASAEAFATPQASQSDAPGPATASSSAAISDRLRAAADRMQREIDAKLAPRLTNTPKRKRQADEARIAGHHLQRTQAAMRALADAHDAGAVPAELAHLRTKDAIHELTRTKIDRSRAGYYDAGIDTGQPAVDTPAARALWAMIEGKTAHDPKAEELRRKVEALQFADIPGYFPTPRAVVERMLDHADIPDSPCDILEPEGGSGAILDVLREIAPNARLTTYELHPSLREVLALKGYELAGSDFMDAETGPRFDRVLMNPPFERGQDIDHVRHAFGMLAPGGRLVAIMSPGPFFRQDRKAQDFRAWFASLGGEKYDLPAGTFRESGTGVATVLVVLRK